MSGGVCAQAVAGGANCGLPVHDVPAELLLVEPAQAQSGRCLRHRDDKRISRVLAVLAERRHPVLEGAPPVCPYSEVCGAAPPALPAAHGPGCVLELHEAVGHITRYLLALGDGGRAPEALTDQLVANLTVRQLLLSRVESRLIARGVIEEVRTISDSGERVTSGRASSLLRAAAQLAQSIRCDEERLIAPRDGNRRRADDGWFYLADDRTGEDDAP